MLQEAALTAFAAVQNHCETRLEKYFAILTFDDSEVAVTQHGLLLEAQLSFHQGCHSLSCVQVLLQALLNVCVRHATL